MIQKLCLMNRTEKANTPSYFLFFSVPYSFLIPLIELLHRVVILLRRVSQAILSKKVVDT